ncbi:MAG TPA: phosphatase PAP2 family protein [Trebonia sp.]|nr:phosphatase PAP2 family protein [Trebonia sp.]
MRRAAWRQVGARPLPGPRRLPRHRSLRGSASLPLLRPGPERRWAWLLLGACVILVLAIGATFAHQTTADGLDRVIDDPVINWLGRDRALLGWLQFPGTQVPAVVLSLAMAILALARRRHAAAVLALIADLVATQLDEWLLKPLFDRTYLGAISYPSGHTTSVVSIVAVYVVLFVLPPQDSRARAWRLCGLAVLLALTVITVIGVIGLRWHYFTDTVGGAAVAVGTVCGLCLAIDASARRLRAARASA